MEIIKSILIGFAIAFIIGNIMVMSVALGRVIAEKYSSQEGLLEKLENFWVKLWRKLI